MNYKECDICPRNCKIDRYSEVGYCSSDNKVKIARASRHMWEEPCISGTNGSGTIFFSGCNLKCVYCQNEAISNSSLGVALSEDELEDLFLKINKSDVHNINLVTATHFMPTIIKVLRRIKNNLTKPIIYNCSGYESVDTLNKSKGLIDIFLPDFKYKSNELSKKYSKCPNYCEVTIKAIRKMLELVGEPVIENGIMKSGVIVRHLILPSHKSDSIEVLNTLYNEFGNQKFLVSLMSQFTPMESCNAFPELTRAITSLEYKRVEEVYKKLNFKGYVQEKSSSSSIYIPNFEDLGEFLL